MVGGRDEAIATYERECSRYYQELSELLSIPSISGDPAYTGECRRAAEWLSAHLSSIGVPASLIETDDSRGNPVVFGERAGDPSLPTILFYGHYDVKAVEPLNLWRSPPFEPTVRDGRIVARGAADDKGQVFYVLKALESCIARGTMNAPIKILLEGEEENGSPSLPALVRSSAERFKADILMVADTGTVPSGAPTIVMGLRGIASVTVVVRGTAHDLHSGVHGGRVRNPAAVLSEMLASMYDGESGRVAIEGFYDGVADPTPEEIAQAESSGVTEEVVTELLGVPLLGGERAFSHMVRVGFRPVVEINGVRSGYTGEGVNTIIPGEAIAKVSVRLVPGQDPERIIALVTKHLKAHAGEGVAVTFIEPEAAGGALRVPTKSPIIERARSVLRSLHIGEPVLHWEGASIPILALLAETSGAEPLLVGFGAEGDLIHAPNESFSHEQWKRGYLYATLLFESFR